MKRFFHSATLATLVAIVICSSASGQIFPGVEPFSVTLHKADWVDAQTVSAEILIVIQKGHMLYSNMCSMSVSTGEVTAEWPQPVNRSDPFTGEPVDVFPEGRHIVRALIKTESPDSFELLVSWQGCSELTCFMPETKPFIIKAFSKDEAKRDDSPKVAAEDVKVGTKAAVKPVTKKDSLSTKVTTPGGSYDFNKVLNEQGLLWVLLIAFLGGVLISLTPCVYPMIPITLSVIGGREENGSFKRSLVLSIIYVFGLALTYAVLGLLVAVFGAQLRGVIQGTWFQLAMAAVFFVLGLSMFDLFMLQAPGFIRRRFAGFKRSGAFGVFLTGMVSGLIASPCIAAPLAGILAFIAAAGDALTGFLMLFSFAWGMGILLIVIGAFSGVVNGLPKAGNWMVKVKEFYGFLLLGVSFYFAQPAMGSPATELAAALLLAGVAAFLGLFSNPSPEPSLGERFAKAVGVVTLAVAAAFAISATIRWGALCFPAPGEGATVATSNSKLQWHDNIEQAIKEAEETNRPVFIDFRADWCSICIEMERNVFPHPEVSTLLQNMILVKFDATNNTPQNRDVLARYSVIGLPTLVFLSPAGDEIPDSRITGGTTRAELALRLRRIGAKLAGAAASK